MKKTLAFNRHAQQFATDVGKPPKRFYLGSDRSVAEQRKIALVAFWESCKETGWTATTLEQAKLIAKGGAIAMTRRDGETAGEQVQRFKMAKQKGLAVNLVPMAELEDFYTAEKNELTNRIAALEKIIREKLGGEVVSGVTVNVHQAIDAWAASREKTELDPETGLPTEHSRTERNAMRLAKRCIDPIPLRALTAIAIETWCKKISNRPMSQKTGKPIRARTANNVIKKIRQWIKWASKFYGWTKPADWHESTMIRVKLTEQERRDMVDMVDKHYTIDELGVLWRSALPSEQILLILALNFGWTQKEIIQSRREDFDGETWRRIRGKSMAAAKWPVWMETKAMVEKHFDKVPAKEQKISNNWNQLLERVCKSDPNFKRLTFKHLRKCGASLIRKNADGETSSLYLSHGGKVTGDPNLDVYASKNWDKLAAALLTLREDLQPVFSSEGITTKTYLPLSKIDRIKAAWGAGVSSLQIAKEIGVSRATVYRFKPKTVAT